jgi:hypothetical protein
VATEDLTKALDEAGAPYELLTHARTQSALAEAEALGLSADDVAKTLIVKTPEGYLRAVVPASCRLDERKLRDVTGGSKKVVHLASEDDLRRGTAGRRFAKRPRHRRQTCRGAGIGRARGRLARAVGSDRDRGPPARNQRRSRRYLPGGLMRELLGVMSPGDQPGGTLST